MARPTTKNKLKRTLIDVCIKLAKKSEGCILCIEKNKIDYELMVEQDIKPFSVIESPRRLERLAKEDGACIISPKGELIAYAAKIMHAPPLKPYGTRHSAAAFSSHGKNTVFLASEEDKKVRVFENGKLIMQIDALEKGIESKTEDIVNIWESLGVGLVGTLGISLLSGTSAVFSQSISSLSTIGVTFIPGVIIFGGTYTLIRFLVKTFGKKK